MKKGFLVRRKATRTVASSDASPRQQALQSEEDPSSNRERPCELEPRVESDLTRPVSRTARPTEGSRPIAAERILQELPAPSPELNDDGFEGTPAGVRALTQKNSPEAGGERDAPFCRQTARVISRRRFAQQDDGDPSSNLTRRPVPARADEEIRTMSRVHRSPTYRGARAETAMLGGTCA